jgi:uncharacterized protein (TIGR02301 family)
MMRLAAIGYLCATILSAFSPAAMAQTKPLDMAPPYEPQVMRLAEILGALSWLRTLCAHQDGPEWQARMKQVMEAENPDKARREKLAGAFNRGFAGYQVNYRTCTPNAELAAERLILDGGRLTRDLSIRFGGG